MSRVIPIGLATDYAAETQSLAAFCWMRRPDGLVVALTSSDIDVVFPAGTMVGGTGLDIGATYLNDPGLSSSSIKWTSAMAVDNLEATFLPNDLYITRGDVLKRKWSDTTFVLFQADPLAPSKGIDVFMVGTTGDMKMVEGGYATEFRSILQKLQQTIGEVTSKTCKAQLFDERCKVDRPTYTYTGTLTAAGINSFADSARLEPDDWFGEGRFEFTSGVNNGVILKLRTSTQAGGIFIPTLSLLEAPAIGDTYTVEAGCRKRWDVDCRDKFDNILNNQSEPHLPGNDYLVAPGDVSNA